MKRLYKLKYLCICSFELAVILSIFSICQISLYCNEKDAVERGNHIHSCQNYSKTLSNKNEQNVDSSKNQNKKHDAIKTH